MQRSLFVALALVLPLAASCAGDPARVGAHASVIDGVLDVDLGDMMVPTGDTLTCFSTGYVTDREWAIGRPMGVQADGGHHLAVYWTEDLTTFEPRPCTDADMINWHMIASAGNEAGGAIDERNLPEGLAFRLPANVHIVVQAHYINPTPDPIAARDSMRMGLLDPTTIDGYAGYYAINDGTFEIPARSTYRRVSDCTVTQELQLITLIGHLHENGRHFSLEYFPGGATEGEMLYDYEWESSYALHAPVRQWPVDAPFVIRPGDRFRMTCEWQNTGTESLLFPQEMCVTSTYYFPDVGEGLLVCDPEIVSSETL